jgi:hypothetical protein
VYLSEINAKKEVFLKMSKMSKCQKCQNVKMSKCQKCQNVKMSKCQKEIFLEKGIYFFKQSKTRKVDIVAQWSSLPPPQLEIGFESPPSFKVFLQCNDVQLLFLQNIFSHLFRTATTRTKNQEWHNNEQIMS